MGITLQRYVQSYSSYSAFPTTGSLDTLYVATDTAVIYSWSGSAYVSNNALYVNTSGFVTLTDGATITPDFSSGYNFKVQLGGSRTLANPTNVKVGWSGTLSIRQDATGNRTLSYGWGWQFPAGTAPTLSTNGFAFDQLYYVVNNYATSTVTMTIAAPCVVSWTAHGLTSGERVQFTTTGALPTGLTANTTYWITKIDADSFNVSTSLANAAAGTYITTTGSQSGVHTATSMSITVSNNLSIV